MGYPLSIWCENCGLIAVGEPVLHGQTEEEVEKRIIWRQLPLHPGTFPVTVKNVLGYLCPNCLTHLIIFHDTRWPEESQWRLFHRKSLISAPTHLVRNVIQKHEHYMRKGGYL